MEQFMINCIEILPEVNGLADHSLYKNLGARKYLLNDYYILNESEDLEKNNKFFSSTFFYGEGINIQAVVGKNGCGKSTLMDLLFAAANNYGYIIDRNEFGEGESHAQYVADLYIRLYYTQGTNNYALTFRDKEIYISDISNEDIIDENVINRKRLNNESFCYDPNDAKVTSGFCKGCGLNYEGEKTVLGKFFYTIVSNYSIHSFVDKNYTAAYYAPYKHGHAIVKKSRFDAVFENKSWIRAIFHKNDGYFRPVVLNPFRENGNIDVNNEIELSKERLASLLIFYSKKEPIVMSPYVLKKINLNFCREYDSFLKEPTFLNKLQLDYYGIKKTDNFVFTSEQTDKFVAIIPEIVEKKSEYFVGAENQFLQKILKKFELTYVQDNEVVNSAYAYLQLKIFKIIFNYSAFKDYEKVVVYNYAKNSFDIKDDDLEKLLDDIIKDNSHITRKIRRTVNFLALENNDFKEKYDWNQNAFFERFTFANKSIFLKEKSGDSLNIDDINDCLPPPFFEYDLIMDKKGKENSIIEEDVDYRGLSSGETQMLQTLSIHAYHISNLLSVPHDRIKYDNINLVFDEVELCFHPEFQREFINRLIIMLKAFRDDYKIKGASKGETWKCFFNVLILTHSPFILSDIQPGRTLFLEETGVPNYDLSKKSTFAGNIGEMFYESFFLKSTIGAFAEEKIKRLVKIRQGKNPDNEDGLIDDVLKEKLDKEANQIFNAISDSIVKCIMEK